MISETQDLVCQGISIPQWFAVWTAPRHEKRVSDRMTDRSIEVYLPVYTTERKWKKRAPVNLELPLFPGYVFVRIPRNATGGVLDTPGVYSIVGNGKQALPVPDTDIEALRSGLHMRKAEPRPYLTVGERVWIRKGAVCRSCRTTDRQRDRSVHIRPQCVDRPTNRREQGIHQLHHSAPGAAPCRIHGRSRGFSRSGDCGP